MSMILFVLHDTEKLDALLAAWQEAGAPGVTILESTGVGRIRQNEALREDTPLMPSLEDFYPDPEHMSRTMFTIVREELVADIVAATQRVTGDLSGPNTGLLVVLPTVVVYGLDKKSK
jgi:nitrogen regulatory protein P-II 1